MSIDSNRRENMYRCVLHQFDLVADKLKLDEKIRISTCMPRELTVNFPIIIDNGNKIAIC